MNTTSPAKDTGATAMAITPPVHLEFIQTQALLAETGGAEEIESYHRAIFLHHHAAEMEKHRQQALVHEERLTHLGRRLEDTRSKLADVDKLVPVTENGEADVKPTAPWNFWDRTMFVASILGIASLLIFGILNISFNLLESGLVTFVENPIRAYFWAALLPVGALAVKVGWDFLPFGQARSVYLWCCLFLGIVGVLVWVGAYAAVYPSLSKTVAEHIETMSVFDSAPATAASASATGAKWIDVITVASQAIAEIFLSAVLGMHLTTLFNRHRPVRLAGNPLFLQIDEERKSLEEQVARERLSLADARGHQTRLENQLTALLAYAKSMFHKETAMRKDQAEQKQRLLDEISEQLRTKLESVVNISNGRGNHRAELPSLAQSNGK